MRIGIVGCGKMASAMVARWLQSGHNASDFLACTATESSAAAVREQLGISCGTDLQQVVQQADLLILGIKPQGLPKLRVNTAPPQGQLWLSLLAGVTTYELSIRFPGIAVARAMPNTAVRIGQGLVGLCGGATVTADQLSVLSTLLSPLGTVVPLSEGQMNAFTSIAGCGPAYVYAFVEALATAAETQGFEPATAAAMAMQVLVGATHLAQADGRSPSILRAEVSSKGGMTEAALAHLAQANWAHSLANAVAAAEARGQVLSELAGQGQPVARPQGADTSGRDKAASDA